MTTHRKEAEPEKSVTWPETPADRKARKARLRQRRQK